MAAKENTVVNSMQDTKTSSKKVEKKKNPNKKPSFFAKIGDFFKSLKSEFKKITWASKESTGRNFLLVMVIVVVAAVVIGLLDWGLGGLLNAIFVGLNKLF